MRTENLERARLLMQHQRFPQAEGELRLHLAGDPEDGVAHALLAVCLLRQEKFDAAEQSARQAVTLEPDASFHHQILGAILMERHRLDDAARAIEEALVLNPVEADLFALRGVIALRRYRWQEALEAAQQGLSFEPDNLDCLNIQAQALVKLGRKEEASQALGGALAKAPHDSDTHASQGWSLLHQNRPKEALTHFSEALRLDPENDFARAGLVEAMKARNIIYRAMLTFFLWIGRFPPRVQIGIVLGGFIGIQVLGRVADGRPALAPFVLPILILYGAFAVMTWVADPLFTLLLRLDRFGRHALSPEQRRGSTVFGLALAVALLGGLVALGTVLTGGPELVFALGLIGLMVFGFALIPISVIWKCHAGWPRWTMGLYSLGVIAFGLFVFLGAPFLIAMGLLSRDGWSTLRTLYFFSILGSQFVANGLVFAQPRR